MVAGTSQAGRGRHSRRGWVRLVSRLHAARASGLLHVRRGRHWRRLWLLGGDPVWYASDVPEDDLGQSLVIAGHVPEEIIAGLLVDLREGQSLRQELVASGALSPDVLRAHLRVLVARGTGAPMEWQTGDLGWDPMDALPPWVLQLAVSEGIGPLRALWEGVVERVDLHQIVAYVTDPTAGEVLPGENLRSTLPRLALRPGLAGLADALDDGLEVSTLLELLEDRTGRAMSLLWFLENSGLVVRAGGDRSAHAIEAHDDDPTEPPPEDDEPTIRGADLGDLLLEIHPDQVRTDPGRPVSWAGREVPKRPAPPKTVPYWDVESMLSQELKHRMGRDYYGFLGLASDTPRELIERTCQRFLHRWQPATRIARLSWDARHAAEELTASVRAVWQVLGDETSRAEYDRHLARGQAPLIGSGTLSTD